MMKYVNTFTVTGSGTFPIDMLRHDRCSPLTEGDASRIAGLTPHYQFTVEPVSIRLVRFTEGKGKNFSDTPTNGRWASMGWKVSDIAWRKM